MILGGFDAFSGVGGREQRTREREEGVDASVSTGDSDS